MGKVFRPYQPDQLLVLPPSMQEWLPADHAVYFVSDLVDSLDLSGILETYTEERGYPPYHPLMMTKLLLYGQVCGIRSSRRLELAAREHVGFRVLCAGNEPDFRTIAEFRRRHLEALGKLFVQVVRLCQRTGLAKLGHIAIDGTKVRASASKHKAMSYQRMVDEEERLKREIRGMLEAGIAEDEADDARYGRDRRRDELPAELAFRESRLKKIQEAKAALEEEERARQKAASKDDDDAPPAVPKPKAQRNFTDPDSRIMLDSDKAFVQAYNAQVAVDADSQVILAADVVQETNDRRQLGPMVQKVEENAGARPQRVSADAGYWSEAAVGQLEEGGSTAYVAPRKIGHREWRELASAEGLEQGEASPPRERMWYRLRTAEGRAEYDKRKISVEPAIGQLKTVQGCRQFLMRGARKVRGEWLVACTGHNILKL